jgi:hypothetical protein
MSNLNRRAFAGMTAAASLLKAQAPGGTPIFDGKTLNGWNQVENNAISLRREGILDQPGFFAKLANGPDEVSAHLRSRVPEASKGDAVAVLRELNAVIDGPSIYERARFAKVALRPETDALRRRNPTGYEAARLNKLLLEDAYPTELAKSVTTGWVVKDGTMASTGAGRGVIYTAKDYSRFRLTFTMRHVSGNPDHQACALIFCTRPKPGEKPLDALAGIQFQPPNGGRWDYRPGKSNNGGTLFTKLSETRFKPAEWSRVEIIADAATGTARMAVAQPPGSKAIEMLRFEDPTAGKPGPVAWQMHNPGLFDEFKDVTIEAS